MVRDEKKAKVKAPKAETKVVEKLIFTDPQLQILNDKMDWIAEQVLGIRQDMNQTKPSKDEEEEEDEDDD